MGEPLTEVQALEGEIERLEADNSRLRGENARLLRVITGNKSKYQGLQKLCKRQAAQLAVATSPRDDGMFGGLFSGLFGRKDD